MFRGKWVLFMVKSSVGFDTHCDTSVLRGNCLSWVSVTEVSSDLSNLSQWRQDEWRLTGGRRSDGGSSKKGKVDCTPDDRPFVFFFSFFKIIRR